MGGKPAGHGNNSLTHKLVMGYVYDCYRAVNVVVSLPYLKRYGLKFKIHVPAGVLCFMFVACVAMGLMAPVKSCAQSDAPVVVPVPEFDWSDYRGTASGRLFLAKLSSINISGPNGGSGSSFFDGSKIGSYLTDDIQLFKEIIGTLYVDRLGLRVCAEEATIEGRHETEAPITGSDRRYPQLDIGPTTIGFDLDIIRYPFVKLGCNIDYGLHGLRLKNLRPVAANAIQEAEWRSDGPLTIGLHAQAIPFRVKEVPAIFVARVRAPFPYLEQVSNALGLQQLAQIAKVKVLDWEVSAGLRPAVWDTSTFGHSTFSFAIELGYRSYTVDTPLRALHLPNLGDPRIIPPYPQQLDLHAQWQGAFFQGAVYY